jgi:hypothetical protein
LKEALLKANQKTDHAMKIWSMCALFRNDIIGEEDLQYLNESITDGNNIETDLWALKAICDKYKGTWDIIVNCLNSGTKMKTIMACNVLSKYKAEPGKVADVLSRLILTENDELTRNKMLWIIRTHGIGTKSRKDIIRRLSASSKEDDVENCVECLHLFQDDENLSQDEFSIIRESFSNRSNRKEDVIRFLLSRIENEIKGK